MIFDFADFCYDTFFLIYNGIYNKVILNRYVVQVNSFVVKKLSYFINNEILNNLKYKFYSMKDEITVFLFRALIEYCLHPRKENLQNLFYLRTVS